MCFTRLFKVVHIRNSVTRTYFMPKLFPFLYNEMGFCYKNEPFVRSFVPNWHRRMSIVTIDILICLSVKVVEGQPNVIVTTSRFEKIRYS